MKNKIIIKYPNDHQDMELGECYEILFDKDKYSYIRSIEDSNTEYEEIQNIIDKYHNINIPVKYMGKTKTEYLNIFLVDLKQLNRNSIIDNVL